MARLKTDKLVSGAQVRFLQRGQTESIQSQLSYLKEERFKRASSHRCYHPHNELSPNSGLRACRQLFVCLCNVSREESLNETVCLDGVQPAE